MQDSIGVRFMNVNFLFEPELKEILEDQELAGNGDIPYFINLALRHFRFIRGEK